MNILRLGSALVAMGIAMAAIAAAPAPSAQSPAWIASSVEKMRAELTAQYGKEQEARITRGLTQVARFWRAGDGDARSFEAFTRSQFAGNAAALDGLFARLEFTLESLDGHMHEIGRDFRWNTDLDLGPLLPVDTILSGYDASAHTDDDLFSNQLAFVVLLNFPMATLETRLRDGASWTSRQWAESRLVERFSKRVPAAVKQELAEAGAEADRYIASYNIWMHHLQDGKGQRPFPAKQRLLSHWNLRDEIKSQYAKGEDGIMRQRMIQKVMERIVDQTIPAQVIDNPTVDWNPYTNAVTAAGVSDAERRPVAGVPISSAREPDTRYQVLLKTYQAARLVDPYSPTAPTHMARSFDEGRQLPEKRVLKMLEDVSTSPLVAAVAKLIQQRLGRPLEPFDIWYNGFRPGAGLDEAKLDAITRQRFPSATAYRKEMPNLLIGLGFKPEVAAYLADQIEVDPARGSGHAMGAQRRGDRTHLRTRIGKDGMDYKGFNIAIHENGHNVEQTFSLHNVDHTLMSGVPNTAFTEALAFVFQARDLELLGQPKPDVKAQAVAVLNDFWSTYEIAGVAMVDTAVWHWMYEHPKAKPADLREATLAIAKDIWNRYYAPVFGQKDCVLLGVYSHMIHSFLYLPDYPVGHMIAFQIQRQIDKTGNLGEEFQRMASLGRLTPDLWMMRATGSPVGPEALLVATAKALDDLQR